MQNQFTPDAEEQSAQKKSSQKRLLLILLLLILLFVYLYFFTGLIRPLPDQGAEAPPPEAPPAAEVAKQPLPPRPTAAEAPASAEATAGKPAEKPAATAQKPAAPAQPAAAAKPAVPAKTEKTAQAGAKPAAPAKAEKPAQAAAKPAPANGAKTAAEKKAVAAEKVKAAKPATDTKTAKAAKAPAKAAAGAYALEINGDFAPAELQSVTSKLKKAGIANVVQTKAQKGEPMHRLFLADFADRNEAAEELERLKQVAPNAFMLKEGGRYSVYAGSFMRQGKAAVEQDRLYDKGVRLVLKEATIPVSVVKLRAGSFADPTSAEKAAASLKSTGLSAHVVKVGK